MHISTETVVCCRLRDKIEHILKSDRAMRLVVAIETALEDKRYDVRLCSTAPPNPGSQFLSLIPHVNLIGCCFIVSNSCRH